MTVKRKRYDVGNFFGKSVIQIILIIWAVLQLYPILWLVYSSFKPSGEIRANMFAFPRSLFLENYDFSVLAKSGITIGIYLRNSAVVTIISLILITIVSLLAGYAIAKIRFPGKNILMLLLIGLLGIPIHSLVIPLYYFIAQIGLLSSIWGLVLPYTAFYAPFSVILLQAFFREFPDDLIEAAKIDGCNNVTAFLRVVMPLTRGAISTVLIIGFLSIWNEFLFSLVINKNNIAKTIPVGLMNFKGQYYTDWGPLLAAMVVAILPPVIFYFIFHRNIIKGMTAGAIKG